MPHVSAPGGIGRRVPWVIRSVGGLVVLGAGLIWLVIAIALSPAGGGVRDTVFGDTTATCEPGFIEWGQLAIGALGALVGFRFLTKLWVTRTPGQRHALWWLGTAVALLVVWWTVIGIGDCGMGSDD